MENTTARPILNYAFARFIAECAPKTATREQKAIAYVSFCSGAAIAYDYCLRGADLGETDGVKWLSALENEIRTLSKQPPLPEDLSAN